MTKILLVRHGHVVGIAPERFRGRADLPLTPEGHRQAEATARRISATWQPTAVYASPLSRSQDTGAAIGRPFGLAPIALPELVDIDYGEWQGLTPDEAKARWPWELDLWYRTPDQAAIPSGETLQEVRTRISSALRTVCAAHPQETIVMVGHDSVNRVILLHALDVPLVQYWRIRQHPCALNEIEFGESGFVIVTVNQTDHLRDI
jgi:probable phosphoglycerate mutase